MASHQDRPRRAECAIPSRAEHLIKSDATAGLDPARIAPMNGRQHLDKAIDPPDHDTDRIKHALAVRPTREMDNHAQPRTKLTVCGFAGQPRGGAQGLDPGRHINH